MKKKLTEALFWQGAHAYHRLLYHVVFVPKYRKRILRGDLVRRLQELLYTCAEVNQWFIQELEVMPDHVHLLLQLPATTPVCQAVMFMKGGTAKVLRQEYPELEEFLWGDSFWQDGYFAETIGRANESVIRKYIQSQWSREKVQTSPGL